MFHKKCAFYIFLGVINTLKCQIWVGQVKFFRVSGSSVFQLPVFWVWVGSGSPKMSRVWSVFSGNSGFWLMKKSNLSFWVSRDFGFRAGSGSQKMSWVRFSGSQPTHNAKVHLSISIFLNTQFSCETIVTLNHSDFSNNSSEIDAQIVVRFIMSTLKNVFS